MTVRLAQQGGLTLPKELRRRYNLRSGDTLSLFDLGGLFALSAHRSDVDALADELTKVLIGRGETLESVLAELRPGASTVSGKVRAFPFVARYRARFQAP